MDIRLLYWPARAAADTGIDFDDIIPFAVGRGHTDVAAALMPSSRIIFRLAVRSNLIFFILNVLAGRDGILSPVCTPIGVDVSMCKW